VLGDVLETRPDVGLACPLRTNDAGEGHAPLTSFPLLDPPAVWRALRKRLDPTPAPIPPTAAPYEVDWVWTTGYLCRRSALDVNRFFDESLFLFGEEYSLCRGIRDRGYKLLIVPAARLKHHASVTWNRNDEKLMVARQLGMAALFSIRRREYGRLLTAVNQSAILGESAMSWGLLAVEKRLTGRSRVSLVDYKAQTIASWNLLRRGSAFIADINAHAEDYFNRPFE
jgi:GT2 family glycosyltransferase